MKKCLYLTVFCLFISFGISAQLYIDQSVAPEVMMMDFFNTNSATVSNVQASNNIGIAFFEGANANLGLNAGIYLSTGEVYSAIGPNSSESTSGTNPNGSDSDLEQITTANVVEHSLIEMDIVPSTSMMNFKYVFASEEYCEFVNSQFNDVFGFFISGPGLDGPFTNQGVNIAMLPDGSPASINTVNHLLNSDLFVGNAVSSCGTDIGLINNSISFDGLTTVMDAEVAVIPGETYHVRIGVGDAGDGIYDSGVFIGIESLGGDSLLVPPSQFTVSIDNGAIEVANESKYATSYLWDFGDGFTTTEKDPGVHNYDFSSQSEYTLTLTTENYCCTDTYSIVVTENMINPSAALTSSGQEICSAESVQFTDQSTGDNITGWEWTFAGGTPATSSDQNPSVVYENAGIFDVSLTVTNAGGLTSTFAEEAYIQVLSAPVADFTVVDLGNGTFEFTDNSVGTTAWNWSFGDGSSSTEMNPTYTFTSSGNFNVTLTTTNPCGEDVTDITVESILNSIDEHPALRVIHFFPNPAKNQITIGGLNESAEIQIYNPLGKLISSQNIGPNENINVVDWPRGLYLLSVQLADHENPAVRRILLK